jgi:hypothetical protein
VYSVGTKPWMLDKDNMIVPDPTGQASLMLCEALIHMLIEKGLLSKQEVSDVIAGVEEIAHEIDSRTEPDVIRQPTSGLLQAIRQSVQAK